MSRACVIGAGPAGLTCAYELARRGWRVEVCEAEGAVGGLSRSIDLWGQRVDLGPHRFFSRDARVNGFWLEHAGEERVVVDRLTRILYSRKFFHYPIRPFEVLGKLGPFEAARCGVSYLAAQCRPRGAEATFEQWVANRFGHRLYSIFFKTYSERLWGLPCTELDADFAAQRIKGLNLGEVLASALVKARRGRHKTLADRFWYPKAGCGQVYEALARGVEAAGGAVRVGSPVRRILTRDGAAAGVELADGTALAADAVVSTAPFTDMVCGIGELAAVHDEARQLRYRNTTLVYLLVDRREIFRDNWIYVHERGLQTGRISNFRNWSELQTGGRGEAILALEYWSYDTDALWRMGDAELVALARRELAATGLVREGEVRDGRVVRLHRSYPVYACGYRQRLAVLQRAVGALRNVAFIGRNGAFKYNNQDHSILMGLLAAENLADGARHDLWQVNTDYDYQEGAQAAPAP